MAHSGICSNRRWKALEWSDLDFHVPGRLVLRHNGRLQYGRDIEPGETLAQALQKMEAYCRDHRDGNPKIVGLIKVAEHTRLNGAPLATKLQMMLNTGAI